MYDMCHNVFIYLVGWIDLFRDSFLDKSAILYGSCNIGSNFSSNVYVPCRILLSETTEKRCFNVFVKKIKKVADPLSRFFMLDNV